MLSELIVVSLIAAIPPTLVALLSLRGNNRNAKAIEEVHLSVNSRMDELLTITRKDSRAEGKLEGEMNK